jgi:hypothetical protein
MLSIDCAVMRAKVGLLERKLMETRQRLEDLNHMAEDADKEMIAARPWVIVPAPDLQARPATSESH